MKTILITNDPLLAIDAQTAGVSRIMVDLESIGKKERQAHLASFISTHHKEDIAKIRRVLTSAALIVRINPWYSGSKAEIDYAIAAGADIIMLPMITDILHVQACIDTLAGRVPLLPLIETVYSMDHIGIIASNPAISELYIGLNDLHLSMGLKFLFEPLANGAVDHMASKIKACNKPFGFGGIAAIGGTGELPPEQILGEHARLGSSCVILSSRFGRDVQINQAHGRAERITKALHDIRVCHSVYLTRSESQASDDAKAVASAIMLLVRK
jgi:hypothetical protein